MKKFILLFFFTNFYLIAYNQVIKGTILDEKTDSTICFASIYVNGTLVGTHSDLNGKFELDISKNTSLPLAISAIGYYSVTLSDFSTSTSLSIHLTPKVYELNEVVIHGKSLAKKRKANLKLFKSEFLGITSNAKQCEIINENDITFNYGSDKDTMKAFASKPILINNKALGYNITYYMDKFEYYKKNDSFFYKGSFLFKEDSTINESNRLSYELRRKNTYLGSRMQFFRALWANDLKSTKFIVKNSADKILSYKEYCGSRGQARWFSYELYKVS